MAETRLSHPPRRARCPAHRPAPRRRAAGLIAAGLAAALGWPGPLAAAEPDLAQLRACVAEDPGQSAACLNRALSECLAYPAEAPAAATLCFRDARQVFSDAVAARMAALRETAPEGVAAVAGIEVKYDMLAHLLQCDRLEELALLEAGPTEAITRQKARCTATAAGVVYLRMIQRAGPLP